MWAAVATGIHTLKKQLCSLTPHIKGLQFAPIACWQVYFTDTFIRERWHYPETTQREINLSFGPVLSLAEITLSCLHYSADFYKRFHIIVIPNT